MSELGTWLIRAREARGLTIEDAERDTRISRRYLQALESEQFEVIPAPVYARGFLRSYSQYLGLDPAEMLALFPRDDQASGQATVIGGNRRPQTSAPQRQQSPQSNPQARPQQPRPPQRPPQRTQPPSAVGPSRPAWRRPDAADEEDEAPRRRNDPDQRNQRAAPERPLEPMIGVDIGVPAPARRIKTDPAAQQRSMLIGVVAVCIVLVVLIFAYLLSSLGGSANAPGSATVSTGGNPAAPGTTSINGVGTPVAASSAGAATGTAPAGTIAAGVPAAVPNVIGMTADKATAAITAAGFKVNQLPASNSAPKGQVFSQAPAPAAQYTTGLTVNIAVSTGS